MGWRKISPTELVSLIPNVVLLFKDLLKDPRVPRSSKALLVGTVAYIVSPIDLIPDFVPFIGPVDDALRSSVRWMTPSSPRWCSVTSCGAPAPR